MKKLSLNVLIILSATLGMLTINGCKKDTVKTTAHLTVNCNFKSAWTSPDGSLSSSVCCYYVSLQDAEGYKVKELSATNYNSVLDFGELNPGNYKVFGGCNYYFSDGDAYYYDKSISVTIIANQDQTISCP